MANTQHEVEEYVSHIEFPTTKEELINGLLARNAPGRMIMVVERLRSDRYESRDLLRADLEEVTRIHREEVAPARSYDDFLAVVMRHVGDIRHTTKESYNGVVEGVIHSAERQGTLTGEAAHDMQQRLEAAFADLRGSMSEVYDYGAPVDPMLDLPVERD